MKKVPKVVRQKKADGGPIKKADVPKDAAFVPNVAGYSTKAEQYINPDGSIGFYYPKIATSSSGSADTPTATPPASSTGSGTGTTPVAITPAVTKTDDATPKPVKPALTRDQQRQALADALGNWQDASAQKVPKDIASAVTDIRTNVQAKQALLDAELKKKYGKAYVPGGDIGQALSYEEGVKALGKDVYDDFLKDVKSYEAYRSKTKGTYDTQSITQGATDPNEQMYGMRMSRLFKNTPEQSAANLARTPKAVMDYAANPEAFLKSDGTVATPKNDVYMIDGENQRIPTGTQAKPGLADIKNKDIRGFSGGGKAVPKGFKKRKGYADGSTVMPDLSSLSKDEIEQYNALTTDADRQAFLANLQGPVDKTSPFAQLGTSLKNNPKGVGALANVAGDLGASAINSIKTPGDDSGQGFFNQHAEELKSAGATGIKRAGQFAALGSAFGPLGTGIGAGVGFAEGLVEGGIKGKKNARAAQELNAASIQSNAADASFKADGGQINGPGGPKSDDIPAEVKKGSFIVPAENAKLAERLRAKFLKKDGGEANLDQGGDTMPVWLSDGEHMFTPEEVGTLEENGIDVDALAPNAKDDGSGKQDGGHVSSSKAKIILKDGTIRGKALTEKQKRYFGWIAGGMKAEGGIMGYARGGKVGTPEEAGAALDAKIDEIKKQKSEYNRSHATGTIPADYTDVITGYDNKIKQLEAYRADFTNPDNWKNGEYAGGDPSAFKLVTGQSAASVAPSGAVGTGEVKPKQSSEDIAALQSAFLAEHDNQNAAVATTDAGKTATAVDPTEALIKEYQTADNDADVNRIRQQLKDLGYEPQYDAATKTYTAQKIGSNAFSQEVNADENADVATDEGAVQPDKTNVQKVFENLGEWGGVMGLAQTAAGLGYGLSLKKPTYAETAGMIDPVLAQRQQQAVQQEKFGYTPTEYGAYSNKIANVYANVVKDAASMSGGNAGAGVANARMAALDESNAILNLAASNEQVKQAKQQRTDLLTSDIATQRANLYANAMNMFTNNQAVAADLMNAGLSNTFGAIQNQKQQEQINTRAAKYGNIFAGLGGAAG